MGAQTQENGRPGELRPGARVEAEYDVEPDDWYFAETGGTMPFCALLETALQPCGWLASAMGIALATEEELSFRNLDGAASLPRAVARDGGPIVTRATLTSFSRSADTIIVSFDVECLQRGEPVLSMHTTFGFFPRAALAEQVGLPASEEDRAWLARPSEIHRDLREPRKLAMLDRITGYWPDGGRAGLGRLRAEIDVDPSAWFFKAHFFQDPVQPGSLGLEAILQLLGFYMRERGLAAGWERVALDGEIAWKFRGQVLPTNARVVVEMEILEAGEDEGGRFARAQAWLWCDGIRIYHARSLGVRVARAARDGPGMEVLDPPSDDGPPVLDTTAAREYWRERLGVRDWLIEDLYFGLAERFVRRVVLADPDAFAALRGRSALFLANHQVAIESVLFSTLISGLTRRVTVALAKAEHRESWLGRLIARAFSYPGVEDPRSVIFFDRKDQRSLLEILTAVKVRMLEEGQSALVHAEGTRALAAGRRVETLSSVWADLSVASGAAIVPVRFMGGLPVAEAEARLDFPVGFGRQDYHVGRPIAPEELAGLPLDERRARILDAINALGPSPEVPSEPDPVFAAAVEERVRRTGSPVEAAVLFETLAGLARPCDETRALVDAARGGRLGTADDPRGRWLAGMARDLHV